MSAYHRATRRRAELPSSFLSVRDILNGDRRVGSIVNFIGVVVDFRMPVSTRGADWKCQIKLYDQTSEDAREDCLALNVFRPQAEMPDVDLHDVVVVLQAKIQQLQSQSPSLLTAFATDILVYSAIKIPPPPADPSPALKPSARKPRRRLTPEESAYVSSLSHSVNKASAPSKSEFEATKLGSANVKDKLRYMKDLRDGIFVDVIGEIVKRPYDMGDKCTLWLSDYTENDKFFNHKFKGLGPGSLDAGPYDPAGDDVGAWEGPYGRRSLQITCFDPHASFIRDKALDVGDWVLLRNLQVKFGHSLANLEGYLREDRGAVGVKINVVPLDISDTSSPHVKEAIRGKRDYNRTKKQQLKDLMEASQAGKKRKADLGDVGKANAKEKRLMKRAGKQARYMEAKSAEPPKEVEIPDLNPHVKCEHQDKPASTIAEILTPILHPTTINGLPLPLQLPFINANYRATVRVINFHPQRLEDFCRPKRNSEYDILSTASYSDSSDSDGVPSSSQWEWRFYLELQDALPTKPSLLTKPTLAPKDAPNNDQLSKKAAKRERGANESLWVAVDNQSAQCLIDLDASDLHHSPSALATLRSKLSLLWGSLEEHKLTREKNNAPPTDSDEDDSNEVGRPFTCCIRQYGVKIPEEDEGLADAGDGRRWQRMFALFGTRLS